jgi:hypothetical protein
VGQDEARQFSENGGAKTLASEVRTEEIVNADSVRDADRGVVLRVVHMPVVLGQTGRTSTDLDDPHRRAFETVNPRAVLGLDAVERTVLVPPAFDLRL